MKNQVKLLLILLFISLICIFIQGTFLPSFLPIYLIPNLVVIIIVFLAFYEVSSFGAFMVFFIGLVHDLSSGVILGPWAASYIVIFGVFSALSQRIFVESFIAAFFAVFVSTLLSGGMFLALVSGFHPEASSLVTMSVGGSFVSGLLAPFFLKLLARLLSKRESVRVKSYSSKHNV